VDIRYEVRRLTERVWIGEASGPLLLLPESLLAEWSGIDVPEFRLVDATFRWNAEEPRASDYDRACDVAGYLGVIPVGHGEGLVLTEGLQATTWLPREWGGVLARWEHAASDAAMDAALTRLPEGLPWEVEGEFTIATSPLVLFNSAEPGLEQVMSRLELALRPGTYAVRLARYAPDPETAAGLIELRRAST
jgi:hypothetical protein